MSTRLTRTAGSAAAVALLLLTGACGGGGRPAAADISKTLQKGVSSSSGSTVKLTETQADCAAKVFLSSSLSDEALRAIADGEKAYKSTAEDNKALSSVRPQLAKCSTS